jgi:hypothetical protein
MRPTDNIEKQIKKLHYNSTPEASDRLHENLLSAFENQNKQYSAPTGPNIWRIIMKNKNVRFITAAIFIIAALLALTIFNKTVKTTYAITDIHQLLRQARTVHIKGWTIKPVPGMEVDKIPRYPLNFWFDLENECIRYSQTGSMTKDGKTTFTELETVFNDQFMMNLDHTNKTVSYSKVGQFTKKIMIRQNLDGVLNQLFKSVKSLGSFEKTGQENIEGVTYEIWQGEYDIDVPNVPKVKMQTFFDPRTGNIASMKASTKINDVDWLPVLDITSIKRNIDLPEQIFSTTPPADYTAQNTKETAKEISGIMSFGNYHYGNLVLRLHISFTLSDGSILFCWSNTASKQKDSQQSLFFEDLIPGSQLPQLPVVVEKIESMMGQPLTYTGRHLAFTQRDGQFFEWSLYVPNTPPAEPSLAYKIIHKINDPDAKENSNQTPFMSAIVVIDSQKDFENLVLGAMAHLSDNNQPPDLTYQTVLNLTNKIRRSLNEQ